jgi:hypothetical protein
MLPGQLGFALYQTAVRIVPTVAIKGHGIIPDLKSNSWGQERRNSIDFLLQKSIRHNHVNVDHRVLVGLNETVYRIQNDGKHNLIQSVGTGRCYNIQQTLSTITVVCRIGFVALDFTYVDVKYFIGFLPQVCQPSSERWWNGRRSDGYQKQPPLTAFTVRKWPFDQQKQHYAGSNEKSNSDQSES